MVDARLRFVVSTVKPLDASCQRRAAALRPHRFHPQKSTRIPGEMDVQQTWWFFENFFPPPPVVGLRFKLYKNKGFFFAEKKSLFFLALPPRAAGAPRNN